MFEITTLPVSGRAGLALPNRFFRQAGGAPTLAVIFPGLNYTADMPLLYYPAALLRQRGADVLQVRADYTGGDYAALPPVERFAWLAEDARAAAQAGWAQGSYSRLVLVGKSIGTLALASLAADLPGSQAATVWLTPLLKQPRLAEAVTRLPSPAFFTCGSADDTYQAVVFRQLSASAAGHTTVLIEAANHSLEIPGDFNASLAALARVMQALAGFLDRQLA